MSGLLEIPVVVVQCCPQLQKLMSHLGVAERRYTFRETSVDIFKMQSRKLHYLQLLHLAPCTDVNSVIHILKSQMRNEMKS